MIAVEIGKTYRNGWGHRRYIMGPHPQHDGVVSALEGDHYRQADGRYVFFGTPTPLATRADLQEEIPTPDHLAGMAEEYQQRGHNP